MMIILKKEDGNMTITESAKQLEISDRCGVLVCGGGIAGISAALAAAREGADVLLVEKQWMVGGLATAGLVTVYLPLCDGYGKQVSFGIAEELLRLSIKHGAEQGNDAWLSGGSDEERKKHRFQVQFNPNLFAIEAERILVENGVRILYGTSVCAVRTEKDKITHVIIENKSGRSAIEADCVIDATGDADICSLAGENTELFKYGNILAGWYYSVKDGRYTLNIAGNSDVAYTQKSEEELKKVFRFGGIDAKEMSDVMIRSHETTLEHFLKTGDGTREKALAAISTVPQVRMTRRLSGKYTIDDTEMHAEFGDSVGMFSDWRKRGPVYELPFSTLTGERIHNLLAAGRCISVTDAMWDITRVIPVCAVSGQAAGTAAAMSGDMTEINVEELQKKLMKNGVVLHESQL